MNLKPLSRSSLLIASDSLVVGGIWLRELNPCLIGLPPTNRHTYPSKEPNSFRATRSCLAFVIVASILSRLRMMPGSWRRRWMSLLLRTVCQLSPACAPSSTRNSNRVLSSCTGTPHSSSWYWIMIGLLLLIAHSHLPVRAFFKSPQFNDGLDKRSTPRDSSRPESI